MGAAAFSHAVGQWGQVLTRPRTRENLRPCETEAQLAGRAFALFRFFATFHLASILTAEHN